MREWRESLPVLIFGSASVLPDRRDILTVPAAEPISEEKDRICIPF